MKLKLYLLEHTRTSGYYDTYDSCVVVAESPQEARKIHPSGNIDLKWDSYTWPSKPELVAVTLIGNASSKMKRGAVVCASFNAG